jgi:hypothetical protein
MCTAAVSPLSNVSWPIISWQSKRKLGLGLQMSLHDIQAPPVVDNWPSAASCWDIPAGLVNRNPVCYLFLGEMIRYALLYSFLSCGLWFTWIIRVQQKHMLVSDEEIWESDVNRSLWMGKNHDSICIPSKCSPKGSLSKGYLLVLRKLWSLSPNTPDIAQWVHEHIGYDDKDEVIHGLTNMYFHLWRPICLCLPLSVQYASSTNSCWHQYTVWSASNLMVNYFELLQSCNVQGFFSYWNRYYSGYGFTFPACSTFVKMSICEFTNSIVFHTELLKNVY